jgi:hypothetical protein
MKRHLSKAYLQASSSGATERIVPMLESPHRTEKGNGATTGDEELKKFFFPVTEVTGCVTDRSFDFYSAETLATYAFQP